MGNDVDKRLRELDEVVFRLYDWRLKELIKKDLEILEQFLIKTEATLKLLIESLRKKDMKQMYVEYFLKETLKNIEKCRELIVKYYRAG